MTHLAGLCWIYHSTLSSKRQYGKLHKDEFFRGTHNSILCSRSIEPYLGVYIYPIFKACSNYSSSLKTSSISFSIISFVSGGIRNKSKKAASSKEVPGAPLMAEIREMIDEINTFRRYKINFRHKRALPLQYEKLLAFYYSCSISTLLNGNTKSDWDSRKTGS